MMFLYNIGVWWMRFGITIASRFNPKARLWVEGRRSVFESLEADFSGVTGEVVWVHCASLGEFEQGRPLIEAIRAERPEARIVLTFFSPSGYQVRKSYDGVDGVYYLPADTAKDARRFVQIIKPSVAIFVKYEYWLNYLAQLELVGCKTYIISAIFRSNSIFFKPHGEIFRAALRRFAAIFVQTEESVDLLHEIGVDRVIKAGDTRFDRVADIAKMGGRVDIAERFVQGARWVFVAGSTWPADEDLVAQLISEWADVKFIVAPHEIEQQRIVRLVEQFGGRAVRYTQCDDTTDLASAQLLVVDTIGVLSKLYRYGNVAYIGGGFGVGIHNTLEAATFGLPLAFGPNYGRFAEARDMVAMGAARSVSSATELNGWFSELYADGALYESRRAATEEYVQQNIGATRRIMNHIFS